MGGMVPDEGIEPPTNGLQNRCSTPELIRLLIKNFQSRKVFKKFGYYPYQKLGGKINLKPKRREGQAVVRGVG